jgi:hypothetical protein
MAEQAATFTESAARRVAKATRYVERMQRNDGVGRLGGSATTRPAALGKADATIASGTSGTVSVWTGQPASLADSGENVSAYALDPGIIEGQWVYLTWIGGGWYAWPFLTNEAIGKADANIAKGASGTISIYRGATPSDTGINISAKALGAAVTANKWVSLAAVHGQWYVAPWER